MEERGIQTKQHKKSIKSYFEPSIRGDQKPLSWGAIFAGVLTFFALLFTLSLIGSAIGFGMVTPTDKNPFDGVGTSLLIWTVVTFILSFVGAGFVAGMSARSLGLIHGFLTWATSLILLILMLSFMTVNVLSSVGSMFGSAVTTIGGGVGNVASASGEMIAEGITSVSDELEKIDTTELEEEVTNVLKQTKIPELQPDYLQSELDKSQEDIIKAGRKVVMNPEKTTDIIEELGNKLSKRVEEIDQGLDKEKLSNAIESETDLSKAESNDAADTILRAVEKASTQTKKQIADMNEGLKNAEKELEKTIDSARENAENATNQTAQLSIWTFVAVFLALIICTLAGFWGANFITITLYD